MDVVSVIVGGGVQHVLGMVSAIVGLLRALGVPGAVIVGPVIVFYLLFSFTYVQFCAVIKLRDSWSRLHIVVKACVWWVAVLALFEDLLVNLLIGPVLFLDPLALPGMVLAYLLGWMFGHTALGIVVAIAISLGTSFLSRKSRGFLFTDRLKYWHAAASDSPLQAIGPANLWRYKCATWLCVRGLNPINPEHC